MPKKRSIILGKLVRRISRLRGDGSALPGLIIEKTDPSFVHDCLSQLSRGVVVVTGTNGKTTTTKIITELLESQGLTVFTNPTGSNFVRGVIASLLETIDLRGNLNADIAVLELDEAHAIKFTDIITPTYSLLLNIMRDQLDRFGEIDYTAQLLAELASRTTDTVITNREDQRLATLKTNAQVRYFGLSDNLRKTFLEADQLSSDRSSPKQSTRPKAIVTLSKLSDNKASFIINGHLHTTNMSLKGIYNSFNAAAALVLVKSILPDSDDQSLINTLESIKSAFGRGESFYIDNTELELILIKNPSGLQLALNSFDPTGHANMIAINDTPADGRDISWLWDVDFSTFQELGIEQISGIRANDMALRLQYSEIPFNHIDEDLITATNHFISSSTLPKRIFCSYSAMLQIRKHLLRITRSDKHHE